MKRKRANGKRSQDKCIQCGSACCRYITIKIAAPRSILDFDNLLWQTYHRNIKVFKDTTGWYLLIYNECVHLGPDGKCAVYANRPKTCREHDGEDCEYDCAIKDSAILYFEDHKSLAAYCAKRFKSWHKRYD